MFGISTNLKEVPEEEKDILRYPSRVHIIQTNLG